MNPRQPRRRHMRPRSALLFVLPLLLLPGCGTTGGVRWYAPATWFSHRAADTVDRTAAREDAAKQSAVKAAQRASHEAAHALASAPASEPVALAVESTETAVRLLDQVAGPLTAGEAARIQKTVAGLLSENATLRAEAQRDRARQSSEAARISSALATAQAATVRAEGKLREAFDRENALANELRGQRALFWIACGVALLVAAAWAYLRFALGGLPSAAGMLMRELRAKHPSAAQVVEPLFDSYLNRHEQTLVARHAR